MIRQATRHPWERRRPRRPTLPTGDTAGHDIRASPPRVALDGPLLHASLVHPPRLTAQLSTRATRPHIPCRHLPTGNTAGHDIRASPPLVALDGPLLHTSFVHPPRLTAKLSIFSTRPHIPCRRGRRRSQEGHHHEPRTVPTFATSGLGATQEPTRSVRANRHPRERRRPRRPISPFRPASPSWKYRQTVHARHNRTADHGWAKP